MNLRQARKIVKKEDTNKHRLTAAATKLRRHAARVAKKAASVQAA